MPQSDNERELETVTRYLEEALSPPRWVLGHQIPDPGIWAIDIRRCTPHIFRWQPGTLGGPMCPDHPNHSESVKPGGGTKNDRDPTG